MGCLANDLVAGQAEGRATVTFSLDPAQNRYTASSDGTTTTTNHFADGGDSPAWTSTGPASWSRNLLGIGGDQAGTVDQAGAVVLNAVNLHGDIVATMPDTSTAAGVSSYFETNEYGVPRNAAAQPDSYGWLGGKRRSGNDLGGLTLMGVRLYNPGTGRFLSVDPVPGGTDNPYVYVLNPTDQYDLDGRCLFCMQSVWRVDNFFSARGYTDGAWQLAHGHYRKAFNSALGQTWSAGAGRGVWYSTRGVHRPGWRSWVPRVVTSWAGGSFARGASRAFGWQVAVVATVLDYTHTNLQRNSRLQQEWRPQVHRRQTWSE